MYSQSGVYTAFRPVYLLCRCLGTMPLRLVTEPKAALLPDRLWLAVCIFCMAISTAHVMVTPVFVVSEYKGASTLATAITWTEYTNQSHQGHHHGGRSAQGVAMKALNPLAVSYMSIGAFIVALTYARRDLPTFFEDLSLVDTALSALARPCSKQDSRAAKGLLLYFFSITTPVTSYFLINAYHTVDTFWDFSWNVVLALNNLVSFSVELQFIYLAIVIQARFKIINRYLKMHRVSKSAYSYFSISTKMMANSDGLTLRQVELLHKSNMKLCDMMKDLNHTYQIQLLCSIAGSFIKTLFNVYYAISNHVTLPLICKISLWTHYYVLRFLVTIIAASFASIEALKTKSLIAQVNSRHRPPDIKEELDLFLKHACSWTIEFSACGLFIVNTQLITTAIASGTTYMVILVQFRPSIY